MGEHLVIRFDIILGEQTPVAVPIAVPETYEFDNSNKITQFTKFCEDLYQSEGVLYVAANQCSIKGIRWMDRVFAYRDQKRWWLVINPEITNRIGISELRKERCITYDGQGKCVLADRYNHIEVKFFGGGQYYHSKVTGATAYLFQQAINQLDGTKHQVVDKDYQLPAKIKIGRNDLCPCGSTKKYKVCCLNS